MVRPSVFMELLCGVNADLFSAAGDVLKLHLAVDLCKQGIVRTDTDIVAGMDVGASLSDQNASGSDDLSVRSLNAQSFRFAVSAVLGRTNALFVGEEL